MAFAEFWGNAATTADETNREWRRLWLAEEEMERNAQAQADQQKLAEQRLAWERENAAAARDAASETEAQRRIWAVWDSTYEGYKTATDPLAKQGYLDIMQSQGSDYYSEALRDMRSSFFDSPQSAATYLTEIYNPQNLEFIPDMALTEAAARSVASALGMDEAATEEYVRGAKEDAEIRRAGGEEAQELAMSDRRTQSVTLQEQLNNIRANTEYTQEQTNHIRAQTIELINRGAREQDLHQGNKDLLYLTIQELQQSINFNEVFNPARLDALLLDNDGKRVSNETAQAMQDYLIDQVRESARLMRFNADVAEADASVALELARLRVIGAETDISVAKAQASALLQQTAESQRRMESMDIQDVLGIQQLNESRYALVQGFAEMGYSELLTTVGRQALIDSGMSEEAADRVIGQLVEVADNNREADQKQTQAAIILADATIDYGADIARADRDTAIADARRSRALAGTAEKDLEYYDADREFEQNMRERGIAVQEGNLALMFDQQAFNQSQAAQAAARATTPTEYAEAKLDLISEIRVSTGINLESVLEGPGSAAALREQYELDVSNGIWAGDEVAQEAALTRVLAAEAEAANRLYTYIHHGAQRGILFEPGDFGLDNDSQLFRTAASRHPAYAGLWEPPAGDTGTYTDEEIDTNTKISNDLNNLAYQMTPDQLATVGASTAYDILLQDYTPEELAGMGILDGKTALPYLQQAHREFTANYSEASQVTSTFGVPDLSSPDSRARATQVLNEQLERGNNLLAAYESGQWRGDPAAQQALYSNINDFIIIARNAGLIGWSNISTESQLSGAVHSLAETIGKIQWLDGRSDSEFMRMFRPVEGTR